MDTEPDRSERSHKGFLALVLGWTALTLGTCWRWTDETIEEIGATRAAYEAAESNAVFMAVVWLAGLAALVLLNYVTAK